MGVFENGGFTMNGDFNGEIVCCYTSCGKRHCIVRQNQPYRECDGNIMGMWYNGNVIWWECDMMGMWYRWFVFYFPAGRGGWSQFLFVDLIILPHLPNRNYRSSTNPTVIWIFLWIWYTSYIGLSKPYLALYKPYIRRVVGPCREESLGGIGKPPEYFMRIWSN